MPNFKRTFIAISAFAAAWGAAFAAAGDKALLDMLVAKQTISAEEASRVAKDTVAVSAKNPDTLNLQFWGMAQMQYDYMNTEINDVSETTDGFNLRRLFLGVKTDITKTFKGYFVVDFMRVNTNGADYILDAYLTKTVDYDLLTGSLHAGIKKVQFGLEENISCMKLSTVDTSIATRYFIYSQRWSSTRRAESRLGFGQRYVGLFWDGKVRNVDGLRYYFSVTNSMNNTINPDAHIGGKSSNPQADDSLNYWLTLDYTKKLGDYTARAGIKTGYGPGANIISNDKYGAVAAIDPYFEFKYKDDFTLWGEFITADIQYGKENGESRAAPMAYNIGAEYRFDIGNAGKLGVATRFCQLFTDGRGVSIKDTVTYSKGATTDTSEQIAFDRAMTAYIGLNWYLDGDNLKIQLGYEWLRFEDPLHLPAYREQDATSHVVRLQIQAVF